MPEFKKSLLAIAIGMALVTTGCGHDDDDDDAASAATTSTEFSVSVTSPDGLTTAALNTPSAHQRLAHYFMSQAHALEEISLTEDAFQVALVNAAGIVTEIVTPLSWSQETDGTYVLELPGGLRLDCVVGVGINGAIELVVGEPLPAGLLLAPTTNPLLDVDVASTAAYENFLATVEDSIDLMSQTSLSVEEVEAIINTVRGLNLPAPTAGQTLEDYIAASIAASQDVVEREVYVAENGTAGDLGQLVSSYGIHWFDGYEDMIEYGVLGYDATTGVTTEPFYEWTGVEFALVQNSDDDYVLGESGWTLLAGLEFEVSSLNADGSISLRVPEAPSSTSQLSGIEVELSGQLIRDFFLGDEDLQNWLTALHPTTTFSAGSLGYQTTWTVTGDIHWMWDWEGCDNPSATGGLCNSVWHWDGDGDPSNDGPAATLESITSAEASTSTNAADVNAAGLPTAEPIGVEFVADGTANIYQFDWTVNPATATKLGTSAWASVTLNSATFYELAVNDMLANLIDSDVGEPILYIEYLGFIRLGEKEPAGASDDGEWVFNAAAQQEILNASLIPCTSGDTIDASAQKTFADFESAVVACGGTQGQGGFTPADVSGLTFTTSEGDTVTFNADNTGALVEAGVNETISWEVNASGYLVITFEGGDTDTIALVNTTASIGLTMKIFELNSGASSGEVFSDALWLTQ